MKITRRSILSTAVAASIPGWRYASANPLLSPRAQEQFGDKVVIAQSAVMSGPSARLGTEMMQGMEAAFALATQTGAAGGRRLILRTKDDGYEPKRCAANTADFLSDKDVFAVGGFVGTPTCMAAMPLIAEAGVPFVGAFTGAPALRTHRPGVFHVRASYEDEARTIVRQLTAFDVPGSGQHARIAIFCQNDGYGAAVKAAAEAAMAERGIKPVAIGYVERNSLDVRDAVEVIRRSGATGVIMATVYKAAAALIKSLGPDGKPMQFISVSFIGTSGVLEELGAEAGGLAICQVVPKPNRHGSKLVAAYRKAIAAVPSAEPTYGGLEGFACGMVIAEGVRRCGGNLTRRRFAEALEAPIDLGDFVLPFSPTTHSPGRFTELVVVDGQGKLRADAAHLDRLTPLDSNGYQQDAAQAVRRLA